MIKSTSYLVVIFVSILLVTNGTEELYKFVNLYSLFIYFFILFSFSFLKFGIKNSIFCLSKALSISDVDSGLVSSFYRFQYKFSYSVAVICFVSGAIIILISSGGSELPGGGTIAQAFGINGLIVFYAVIYSELLCRLKFNKD
ncbi:hypothetical protein OE749_09135 [Aestuariibacter sp. AA17]|uniref:Uncharacterized protein n=1 Tax=Fluctibacter corallii TaxID=2984329 RepID=A0ABT3A844_9ALTE|nr:hypothetical protein [Aestuariibacter sp. AA17]MCV2884858.1 hypothetical protein [Aestuariibacter sp. AA17]